jgi:hypothetical protein
VSRYRWDDKDPADVLDYDADFAQANLPAGEGISSVDWSISPTTVPALEIAAQTHDDPTMTATVWLSGGVVDTDYTITCKLTLTTTGGSPVPPVIERDIGLNVRNLDD